MKDQIAADTTMNAAVTRSLNPAYVGCHGSMDEYFNRPELSEFQSTTEGAAFIVITKFTLGGFPEKWYAIWADGRTYGFEGQVAILNRIPVMMRNAHAT